MRRLAPIALPLLVVVVSALAPQPAARAADQPTATLALLSQSALNGPARPLLLSVRATNTSNTQLTGLSFSVQVYAPPSGRIQYDESLKADVTSPTGVSAPFVERGSLAPGQSRTFRLRHAVDALSSLGGSGLYPIRIDLQSNLVIVATVRTPMVYLTEQPALPLGLAWTWVLWEPLQLGPDGVLEPGPIERDIAPGGRLFEEVRALVATGRAAVDVALSSVLLEELDRMSRGYRVVRGGSTQTVAKGTAGSKDAQSMLDAFRVVAARPGVELAAFPFADPNVPSLVDGGLGKDLRPLMQRGRDQVRTVGGDPSTAVFRPPGGQVGADSLSKLARMGVRTLLLDAGTAAQIAGTHPTPLPAAKLAAGGHAVTAILPDTRLAATLAAYRQAGQEVQAAHVALGELAVDYFEAPAAPDRGAAVLFPERPPEQPAFFGEFGSLVRASPWLGTVTATRLASSAPPSPSEELPDTASRAFAPAYVQQLLAGRESLRQFTSAVQGQKDTVAHMTTNLWLAEGGAAAADRAVGDAFLSSVTAQIHRTFRQISPPPSGYKITLTSLHGGFFVTVRNDSSYSMRLQIRLVAPRQLTFQGNTKWVTIPAHTPHVASFSVRAQTTGRFPVEVQVLAPAGETIAKSQMIVRSTAYNRVALVLTIGAALFLLFWWGRRFLPRPTS